MSEDDLFIGLDVGTGSARAGLFTGKGRRLGVARRDIKTWTNPGGSLEQSTEDIWSAACSAVEEVCSGGGYGERVVGIGFAATCSLAVVDPQGHPVTVSPSKDPNRNVVLWQDHRAVQEAVEINSLQHPVLRYMGGALSPEMQPPKLLWLKRHLHDDCWKKAGHFFDLADYLTFRATGASSRSLCCVVCKWTYIGHTPDTSKECDRVMHGWNDSFWEGTGLGDLVSDGYRRIGVDILAPGKSVGKGLTQQSANDMGLCPGTAVATSLIDAHAGGVGVLSTNIDEVRGQLSCHVTSRLALIGGTSTCHMAMSSTPVYVPGVWGPYYSAMLPGYYLSEGGQSTTGQLLDYVLHSNTAVFSELQSKATHNNCSVYEELERTLCASSHHLPHLSLLTSHLHVVPDFHGNRSPLSDPTIRGMISGQSMIATVSDLAVLYLSVAQALAFGTRHIIDAMNTNGHSVQNILVCGGLRHNTLYIQAHADITGFPVVLPAEEESVLLGAAILAATATQGEEVPAIMEKMMNNARSIIQPSANPAVKMYYNKKYSVFLEMYKDQQKYASLMS